MLWVLVLFAWSCVTQGAVTQGALFQLGAGEYDGDVELTINPPLQNARRNRFVFGQPLDLGISLALKMDLPKGATLEVSLTELHPHPTLTRIGVNSFISPVDVCKQLGELDPKLGLPSKCPVPAKKRFSFSHTITKAIWEKAESFKTTMIGSYGKLRLRLLSGPPCVVCMKKPQEFASLSIPFEIVDKADAKITTKNAKDDL